MISKKSPVRIAAKGKVAHLINYLLDKKGKDDRVAGIVVSNCQSDDPKWAIHEMQAVQDHNQRAKGDKTYHLVISLRSGEDLPPAALADIEAEFARALGFAEHQRLSVVHRDTDNLHLHVAINKVHPTKFTLHEPFNDYYTRQQVCERMESRYGLATDRAKERRAVPTNAKAATMEAAAGVESLIGYVQRNLAAAVGRAASWRELHEEFAKAGVQLKPKGNGLVVESGGVTAKASSCFRELSRTALERRLGSFEGPGQTARKCDSASGYEPRPLQRPNGRLYEVYQAQRQERSENRWGRFEEALEAHQRRVKRAKAAYHTQRTIIGLTRRNAVNRVMLQFHRANLRRKVEASYRTFKAEKTAIHRETKLLSWNDWLMEQAASGNQEARVALQKRRKQPTATVVAGQGRGDSTGNGVPPGRAYVTRSGTLRGVIAATVKLAVRAKEWTAGR